ncbi:Hypothetical_protein [Hexamita inflata]|uniref:Hypothetical_protein n=1 Tax=Hexamita inflata TaxID=28002 RepID=A0AA86QRW6_9EUKA|nr:Hypothetical protein HINF_LOCUS52521 [Hexamita inflata]
MLMFQPRLYQFQQYSEENRQMMMLKYLLKVGIERFCQSIRQKSTLRTKCKDMDRSQIQSAVQLLHPRINQQQSIEVGTCRCRYLCVLDGAIHVGRVAFNRYITQNLRLDQNLILNKILQVLIIVGEPTISIKYVADKLGLNADLVTLVVLNSFIGSSYKLVF